MQKDKIHFTKMHALGNDFIIINAIQHPLQLSPQQIKQLANRHTAIGFDQLLTIEKSKRADYFCHIYNADGSEAEQCANGLRCVARYLHEEGINTNSTFQLATKGGITQITIDDYDHIHLHLPAPSIQKNQIALNINPSVQLNACVLSLGNPHAIIKVANIDDISIEQLGKQISTHRFFPQGANVGFMQVIDEHHVRLRTYERGVGETYACGSNACAAVVAGIANGWLDHHAQVDFHCGSLLIKWQGEGEVIHLVGPAVRVFDGALSP